MIWKYFKRENLSDGQVSLIIKAMRAAGDSGNRIMRDWCISALRGEATQWYAYKAANSALQFYEGLEECTPEEMAEVDAIVTKLQERMWKPYCFNADKIYQVNF